MKAIVVLKNIVASICCAVELGISLAIQVAENLDDHVGMTFRY